jgi:hypothetical protein
MSPSVMTLPARNFKFLTEGSLRRTGNYRLCEKEGRVGIWLGDPLLEYGLSSPRAPVPVTVPVLVLVLDF